MTKINFPPTPVILKNVGSSSCDMYFYEEFGPDWYGMISSDLVRNSLGQLAAGTAINLFINSPGGDVLQAMAIYSLFKNWTGQKTCYVTNAWSCASWVAQACDKRVMDENGLMMIHDPETSTDGNEAEHVKAIDLLQKVKSTISGVYAARSGKTPDDVGGAMSAETWFTPNEAVDWGLADEISANKGAPVTMRGDVKRFKNAPKGLQVIDRGIAPIEPKSNEWKRLMNERRQLLLELEIKI